MLYSTQMEENKMIGSGVHTSVTAKEIMEEQTEKRMLIINSDFEKGFDLIRKHPRSVTIFGSARFTESHPYYEMARKVAARLSEEGFAVVTGGGQGVMEAANRGAFESGGKSIGFNIELPFEQTLNSYVTENVTFNHFFSRKVLLAFSAEAYIFFPGGFGTLDEFFEIITLVQTYKIPRVPIVLVGNEFWKDFHDVMRKVLIEEYKTISPEDLDLYVITEDMDEIMDIVNNAPMRQE